jgi:uncharacterized protein
VSHSGPPWQFEADSVRLTVRVVPRARRNEAAGIVDVGQGRTALAIRVRAPAAEGAANSALIEFLAAALAVPRAAVVIESGAKSRLKRVRIEAPDPDRLGRMLGL